MRTRMGFTLVEILIAMMILSIAITAALQVSNATLRLGAQSQYALWASKGVQEYYLEYFRSLPFSNSILDITGSRPCPIVPAVTGDLPPVIDPTTAAIDRLPPPTTGSQCQYWVDVDNTVDPGTNLRRVTIEVRWTDPDNRQRSSVISTLITNAGITS